MHTSLFLRAVQLAGAFALGGCGRDDSGIDLHTRAVANRLAYVPPQCFTRTLDPGAAKAQNPCYVCHADAAVPNYQGQPELQLAYAFPQLQGGRDVANPWTNLFADHAAAIGKISDRDIARYVADDNYHDQGGTPVLAKRLAQIPQRWDVNGDGRWSGYLPDAGFRYDAQGYDLVADGQASGWRRFSYYPLPGAFMPTNGSFDDVLIRLAPAFREDEQGAPSTAIYSINLAIVEALIRRADIDIDAADEKLLGVDLDGDGRLGSAVRVHYDWQPTAGRDMSYVGRARLEQAAGSLHLAAGLYPEGTEFLHSVRYLAVDGDGKVRAAPRMKELRYARKLRWLSYSDLHHDAGREAREAELNPNRLEHFNGDPEQGLQNLIGWSYQGFIEDRRGRLRPQTYEETVQCMGCHGGLSATEDGSFALPRKGSSGAAHGWGSTAATEAYALPDPLRTDGKPEFASYLENNHAGDEYRANGEILKRYFQVDGTANAAAFKALRGDLSALLLPSQQRALLLDKAYRVLVQEQSFTKGRDALPAPAVNVHREIAPDAPTGITAALAAPRLGVR
ncbi:MAG: hypothetical protein ACHQIO_03880 [Nevskiales bacterium]